MLTRKLTHADYLQIVSVIDHWWGGPTSALAHPLFFHELGEHALVAEDDSGMVGFLLGFINHTAPRVGYIHLVGIDPTHRRRGVGRTLYDEFTRAMLQAGVRRLKAITTPGNHGSIEFHKANGYDVTLVADYAGPGRDRYVFTRSLENQ